MTRVCIYAIPLNKTANTIEKIVVKLKFFNLNIAKSAPNNAPTKLSNAIITKMKLIKQLIHCIYCIERKKIIFAKSFLINCNYYKIYKNTRFIQIFTINNVSICLKLFLRNVWFFLFFMLFFFFDLFLLLFLLLPSPNR